MRVVCACLLALFVACGGDNAADQPDDGDAAQALDGQTAHTLDGQTGYSDAGDAGTWLNPDAGPGTTRDAETLPPWIAPPPARVEAPDCGGSALACSSRTSSSCLVSSGCRLDGDCNGSARSCYNQISTYSCTPIDGCYWNSSSKYCGGSSRNCSSYSASSSCSGQPGCSWSQQCAGTATACELLTGSSCTAQPGCAQTCSLGLSLCSASCVDLNDDEQNCGSCGFACGPRSNCRAGRCECGAPFIQCGGRCVDPKTANENCGRCGNVCDTGYACQSGSCADRDECALAEPCFGGRECVNTVGSFSCGACPAGYQTLGTNACVDVNECAVGNGGCDPQTPCINSVGSFSCGGCAAGYTKQPNGTCLDNDECSTGNGGCDALTTCTNTPGTRVCSSCPTGYTGSGASGCSDLNECLTSSSCDPLVSCQNTTGSYTCSACPAGYSGDGKTGCKDVDECALNLDNCAENAICTNTTPGFNCRCQNGYELVDGLCRDIDECARDGLLLCPGTGRRCSNTQGSYDCVCPAGMTEAGAHCAPMLALYGNACGLTLAHQMRCQSSTIQAAQPQAGSFAQLDMGPGRASCAVRLDASLHCWGEPGYFVTPPTGSFSYVGVGWSHACALGTDGQVTCWNNVSSTPQGQSPQGTFVHLSVGMSGNCAIRADHSVYCWGDFAGQQPPAGVGFSRVSVGNNLNACGVTLDGKVHCWGGDVIGLLAARPSDAGYIDVRVVSWAACAQRADRTLKCWTSPGQEAALQHPDAPLVQYDMDTGICGITTTGVARCWDKYGQVPANFP